MLESKKRANKKYNAKYKERTKTIRFDCYPTDTDIIEYLEAVKAAGEPTATYIKRLIREDMKKYQEKHKRTIDEIRSSLADESIHSAIIDEKTFAEIQEKLARDEAVEQFQNYFDNILSKKLKSDK